MKHLNHFLGVMPDSATTDQLDRRLALTQKSPGYTGKPRPPELLHTTLHSIDPAEGVASAAQVEEIRQAVAAVRFPAFKVTFDRVMSFNTRKESYPFVLTGSTGLQTLHQFHQLLGEVLRSKPWIPVKQRFTPHVTLAYFKELVPARATQPVSWTVNEFVLVRSYVGASRYEILDRWPLLAAMAL